MPWPVEIAKHGLPGVDGRVHVVIIAGGNEAIAQGFDEEFPRVPTCGADGAVDAAMMDWTRPRRDRSRASELGRAWRRWRWWGATKHLDELEDPEFNITCVDALPEDGPQGRFVWSTHSTFGKDVARAAYLTQGPGVVFCASSKGGSGSLFSESDICRLAGRV